MSNSRKTRRTEDGFDVHIIRKNRDLADCWRSLSQTIAMCEDVETDPQTTLDEKRSFGHLKIQAVGILKKIFESVDLAAELEKIKEELAELKQSEGLRKVA